MPYLKKARKTIADIKRLHILEGLAFEQTSFLGRYTVHKYYEECDWSKTWAEGLQKILLERSSPIGYK